MKEGAPCGQMHRNFCVPQVLYLVHMLPQTPAGHVDLNLEGLTSVPFNPGKFYVVQPDASPGPRRNSLNIKGITRPNEYVLAGTKVLHVG